MKIRELKNEIIKNFMKYKYVNFSIILVTLIICVCIIMVNETKDYQDNDVSKNLENLQSSPVNDETDEIFVERPDRTKEYKEAYAKNKDTVGWIYIPGTTIDWPVMQGANNDYYLRKNEEKEYAFDGCIFGDDDSVFSPFKMLSNNLVIHGHNLDDNPEGKRFAQLVKFQNKEFAENTPYIFLTTADEQLVYEIYAVFFTDVKFGYNRTDLDKDLQQFMINSAKKRSEYIYDVDVTGLDKLITLSTCTYKYGAYGSVGQKNTRFVVQGKLLKTKDALKPKASLTKNMNPEAPHIN